MNVESTAESMPATRNAPLRVAYDAQALVSGDGGTGKGVQLRNLIGSRWAEFQGYAPSPESRARRQASFKAATGAI